MSNPFTEFLDEDPARRDMFLDLIVEIITERTAEKQRLKNYNDGLIDTELAELWGISSSGVHAWRDKKGLDPNGNPGNQPYRNKKD